MTASFGHDVTVVTSTATSLQSRVTDASQLRRLVQGHNSIAIEKKNVGQRKIQKSYSSMWSRQSGHFCKNPIAGACRHSWLITSLDMPAYRECVWRWVPWDRARRLAATLFAYLCGRVLDSGLNLFCSHVVYDGLPLPVLRCAYVCPLARESHLCTPPSPQLYLNAESTANLSLFFIVYFVDRFASVRLLPVPIWTKTGSRHAGLPSLA